MTRERNSDSESVLPASVSSLPEATQVLCEEVGAAHPDGALRQIQTMKRLLRSHYRVKQRLEQYGVDSLSDAVAHIAHLTRQVRRLKKQERERALDRVDILDELMSTVNSVQQRLRALPDDAEELSPPDEASEENPLHSAKDLIASLKQALDEIRLELWLHQSDDEPPDEEDAPHSPATAAVDNLVDQLAEEIDAAAQSRRALEAKNNTLAARNESLEQDVDRLKRTVEQQQERIRELEQQQSPPQSNP